MSATKEDTEVKQETVIEEDLTHMNEEVHTAITRENMKQTLATILRSLTFTEMSFTFSDLLRYSTLSLFVLFVLVYIFPGQILLILISMVFIVVSLLRVTITSIINNREPVITGKPFDQQKLNFLKNKYLHKKEWQLFQIYFD